jgi:hypothetical protein
LLLCAYVEAWPVSCVTQIQQVEPFVVHTTFQYGGPAGKLSRLRERNLWKDDDAYFRVGPKIGSKTVSEIIQNYIALS